MTEEAGTISTPAETTATTDTSASEVSTSTETTSQTEPESVETTAESETQATTEQTNEPATEPTQPTEPEKLYANKYKSVEELEKGYAEAQKTLTQNAQYKNKYEELLKQQEARQAIELEKVKQQGFNSVEERQIAYNADLAEYQAFCNSLDAVGLDNAQEVQGLLQNYYATGNKAFLEEAKRYYPSGVLETIAINKQEFINQSKNDLTKQQQTKAAKERQERERLLADEIKANYTDFLSDIETNKGKSNFLERVCNLDLIQSKADMDEFVRLYSEMAKHERELAIKEYEAKKVIEETKEKASIGTDGQNTVNNGGLPTAQMINNNPKLYREYVKKYGMDKIDNILMKG